MSTIYTVNGKVLKNAANDKWLTKKGYPALPDYSFRGKFTSGYDPTTDTSGAPIVSATQIDAANNIWDIVMSSNYFGPATTQGRSGWKSNLIKVLDINCGDSTSIGSMFQNYTALEEIDVFDSSNITDMSAFLSGTAIEYIPLIDTSMVSKFNGFVQDCTSLKQIPALNFSSATECPSAFRGCINVESGILAAYNALSAHVTTFYAYTFTNCGSNTVTGAAELAQIPGSWGGTGA